MGGIKNLAIAEAEAEAAAIHELYGNCYRCANPVDVDWEGSFTERPVQPGGGQEPLTSGLARSAVRIHRIVLSAGSALKPSFQGRLAFGGRYAEDQVLHADVLIQPRPVNSATTSDESPILPFLCCSMAKARIPRQRNGNRATIREFGNDAVIGNDERRHTDVPCVNRGRSHSKNPSIAGGFRLQSARSGTIPSPRSPNYVPGGRDQAKSSLRSRHVPHEYEAVRRRRPRRRTSGTVHSSRLWASQHRRT